MPSSSGSSRSAQAVSVSSSRSSSKLNTFPTAQVHLSQSSPPMNATDTPARGSQDRTSRKRKVSEIEINLERGQSRYQCSNFVYPNFSQSSLYTEIVRLWPRRTKAKAEHPCTSQVFYVYS
jgi:hypothetical protein